jgi:hypothetical protein
MNYPKCLVALAIVIQRPDWPGAKLFESLREWLPASLPTGRDHNGACRLLRCV